MAKPVDPRPRDRPANVATPRCELCKQRKVCVLAPFPSQELTGQVKCDRGQPSCGWCSRNGALCEYKERKKPGLRAGYGRELEQRLDKLEEILRTHSEILAASWPANTPANASANTNNAPASLRNSNPSN